MSEFDPKHPAQSDERESTQEAPGATGIFGVLPTSLAPKPDLAVTAPETGPSPAVALQSPSRFAAAPVVVHEVKFQAQDAEGSEAESSLQRLLQSLAPASEKPVSAAESGDFTRLLSTLQIPPAPTPATATRAAATPVPAAAATPVPAAAATPVPAAAATPVPAALEAPAPAISRAPELPPSSQVAAPPADASSFTRLFEALSPPVVVPGESPPAVSFTARVEAAPPPMAAYPSVASAPPAPADARGAGELHASSPQSSGKGTDAASFTQLFNALGSQPRPEPSQAADYPPLAGPKPAFAPFPAAPSPGFSGGFSSGSPSSFDGGGWSPGSPSPAPVPSALPRDDDSDLSSLTQLLQALEHPPAAAPSVYATGASAPQGRDGARSPGAAGMSSGMASGMASGISGATVAFTPPESVQRRSSQPPAAPSGPGDFTRVLQASALRESGLGSQAAAAHPPPTPVASAPPVHGAGAPLPPWAAPSMPHVPSMPYAPHVSGMSHANGGIPGMGSMPGMHGHPGGPQLHMPSAFMTPGPVGHGVQGGQGDQSKATSRGTILTLILLAIIVILVGALVALLLRH